MLAEMEDKEDSAWDSWIVNVVKKIHGQKQKAGLDRIYDGIRILAEKEHIQLVNQKSPIAPIYQIPLKQIGFDLVKKHLDRTVKSGLLQRIIFRGNISYRCSEDSVRNLNLYGITQEDGELLLAKCIVKCMIKELSDKDPGSDSSMSSIDGLTLVEIIDYIRYSHNITYPPVPDQVSYLGVIINGALTREISKGEIVKVGNIFKYNPNTTAAGKRSVSISSNSNDESPPPLTEMKTEPPKPIMSTFTNLEIKEITKLILPNTNNSEDIADVGDQPQSMNLKVLTSCTPVGADGECSNLDTDTTSNAALNSSNANDVDAGHSTLDINIAPIIDIAISHSGGGGGGDRHRSESEADSIPLQDITTDFINIEVVNIELFNEEVHGIPYDIFNYDENVKYKFEAQFKRVTQLIPGFLKTSESFITPNGLKWQIGIKFKKSMSPKKLFFCLICENEFSPVKEVTLDVIFNIKRMKCINSRSAFCRHHKKGSNYKMNSNPGSLLTYKEKNIFNNNNYVSLHDLENDLNHFFDNFGSISVEVIFRILKIQNLPQVSSFGNENQQKQNPFISLDKLDNELFMLYSEKLIILSESQNIKKWNSKVRHLKNASKNKSALKISTVTSAEQKDQVQENKVLSSTLVGELLNEEANAISDPNALILPTRTRPKKTARIYTTNKKSKKRTIHPHIQLISKVGDWINSQAFSDAEELDDDLEPTLADGQIEAQSSTNNNNINIISTTNSLTTTIDFLQGKRTKLPSLKIRENQTEVNSSDINQKFIIDQVARGVDVDVMNQSTEELPIIDEVNRRENAIDIKDMNQFNQITSSLSLNNIDLGSIKQDKSCKSPVKLSPDIATVNQKTPGTVSVPIPLFFNANEQSSIGNDQHNNNIENIIESVAVASNAARLSALTVNTDNQNQRKKGRKFLQKSATSKRQKREMEIAERNTNNEAENQNNNSAEISSNSAGGENNIFSRMFTEVFLAKKEESSYFDYKVKERSRMLSLAQTRTCVIEGLDKLETSSSSNVLNENEGPKSSSDQSKKLRCPLTFLEWAKWFPEKAKNLTTTDTTSTSRPEEPILNSCTRSSTSSSDSSHEEFQPSMKTARNKGVSPKKITPIVKAQIKRSNESGLCLRCLASVPKVELKLHQKKKMCPNCIFILQQIKPATISNPNNLQQGDQSASIIGNEEIPSNLSSNEYARKTRSGGARIILAKNNTTRKNKKNNNNTQPPPELQIINAQTVLQNNPLEIPPPLLTHIDDMELERLIQCELLKSEPDQEVIEDLISRQEEVVRRRQEEGQGEQPGPSQPRTTQTSGTEEASANNLNNDCPHFFKPHGCLMGSECQLGRHSEAALDSFIECPKWKINNGFCDDWILCNLRHMNQVDIDNHKRKFIDNPEEEIQAKKAKLEEEEKVKKKPAEAATTTSKTIVCPVCLEDYDSLLEKNFHLGITQCGHPLCVTCGSDLLKKKAVKQNKCPICRTTLTKKPTPCFF